VASSDPPAHYTAPLQADKFPNSRAGSGFIRIKLLKKIRELTVERDFLANGLARIR
jgi:hypothetical protein